RTLTLRALRDGGPVSPIAGAAVFDAQIVRREPAANVIGELGLFQLALQVVAEMTAETAIDVDQPLLDELQGSRTVIGLRQIKGQTAHRFIVTQLQDVPFEAVASDIEQLAQIALDDPRVEAGRHHLHAHELVGTQRIPQKGGTCLADGGTRLRHAQPLLVVLRLQALPVASDLPQLLHLRFALLSLLYQAAESLRIGYALRCQYGLECLISLPRLVHTPTPSRQPFIRT